jgi:hypothetical protein
MSSENKNLVKKTNAQENMPIVHCSSIFSIMQAGTKSLSRVLQLYTAVCGEEIDQEREKNQGANESAYDAQMLQH